MAHTREALDLAGRAHMDVKSAGLYQPGTTRPTVLDAYSGPKTQDGLPQIPVVLKCAPYDAHLLRLETIIDCPTVRIRSFVLAETQGFKGSPSATHRVISLLS